MASREIKTKGQRLEEVENFKYLGASISNEGSKPEILSRIPQTTAALSRLKILWSDKNISLVSKVKLMRTLILSIFFYACESWTLTAEIERRLQAHEMRCCRRLLNISYKDHVKNEELYRDGLPRRQFLLPLLHLWQCHLQSGSSGGNKSYSDADTTFMVIQCLTYDSL